MHDALDVHVFVTDLSSRATRSQRFRCGQHSYGACAVSLSFCIVHALDTLAFLLSGLLRTFLFPEHGLLLYLKHDYFPVLAG